MNNQMVDNEEKKKQEAEKQKAIEAQKSRILHNFLDPEAIERLNTIRLVKPEDVKKTEEIILQNIQMGRLGKVTDDILKEILEKINATRNDPKLTIERKKYNIDDSDDFENLFDD